MLARDGFMTSSSKDDIDAIGTRNIGGGKGIGNWYSIESEIRMGREYAQFRGSAPAVRSKCAADSALPSDALKNRGGQRRMVSLPRLWANVQTLLST